MKKFIGILLVTVGIVALAYEGIRFTTREKVIEVGPVEVTSEKTRTIPLSPIVGVMALTAGVLILVLKPRHP